MKNCSDPETRLDFNYITGDYTYCPFNSTIYRDKVVPQFSILSDLANWINQMTESSARGILRELVRIYNAGGTRARRVLKEEINRL